MVMDNETTTGRLRRKLTELSNEYTTTPEKPIHSRSKSASSRVSPSDPNASLRYRRMRRKVDDLRTQIDAALQDNYLTTPPTPPPLSSSTTTTPSTDIATRDHYPLLSSPQTLKKKTDEHNLVTGELIQVLHSKQTKIDELEQKVKQMEEQESQWKIKYEREHRQREVLQSRYIELEKELVNRQQQSKLLAQLQIDIKRLHLAFDALEAENANLTAQLTLAENNRSSAIQLDQYRHDIAQVCHESLC